MSDLQTQFIEFLLENNALQFGAFTLKSGRVSPYFFNLGVFHTGSALEKLGYFYAQTLLNSGFEFDLLFGPAYKGIPLATATSIVLSSKFQKNTPYCFNRKEKKAYGDSGEFVGATPSGNIVMLDDVITAGTTVKETVAMFENTEAKLSGIIIAFDRQECGTGELSAVQETMKNHKIPVQSIISLSDIIQYLKNKQAFQPQLSAIENYQKQYGA